MIIFPRQRIIFIHSPRTGGTAFQFAAAEQVPGAILRVYSEMEQHMPAWVARVHYPGHRLVTVTRNPWDVLESIYRMAHAATRQSDNGWPIHVKRKVESWARMSFDHWLRFALSADILHIREAGGFTAAYADKETKVFRYDNKPYERIAELLGVKLQLRKENSGARIGIPWTPESIELARESCHRDIDVYDYQPPFMTPPCQ